MLKGHATDAFNKKEYLMTFMVAESPTSANRTTILTSIIFIDNLDPEDMLR